MLFGDVKFVNFFEKLGIKFMKNLKFKKKNFLKED